MERPYEPTEKIEPKSGRLTKVTKEFVPGILCLYGLFTFCFAGITMCFLEGGLRKNDLLMKQSDLGVLTEPYNLYTKPGRELGTLLYEKGVRIIPEEWKEKQTTR